jgi:hypothetical protein
MYERSSEPLLPRRHFVRRLALHLLWATGLVAVSLGIGTIGYHALGKLTWLDAFLNAAMLLGGMGPVGELSTNSGKVFAGLFALYAGLVLITVTALLLAPVLHRVLHSVHLDDDEAGEQTG